MRKLWIPVVALICSAAWWTARSAEEPATANDADGAVAAQPVPPRPRVAGDFKITLRERVKVDDDDFRPIEKTTRWKASETAIIICDMWNGHYCLSAAQRVDEMAPRMNSVVTAARNHGTLIIHAPSGTMDQYEDAPFRRRAKAAPKSEPPVEIAGWCYLDPETEAEMPVDASKQPCDDPVVGKAVKRFTKQHPGIQMIGFDAVSDKGDEIYNLLKHEGIKNVVLMGVHTNMCVLGRPFGIRQMVRLGFNVALARDLTDAMYDPREYPHVSHTRGTQLVVEHIETYWCPSLLGEDLTRVITGTANPDAETVRNRPKLKGAAKE